ncbi:MAG: hypothetical protein ACI92I_000827 [Acidimicrobiales bacterium]|jgi:hypothetical protein
MRMIAILLLLLFPSQTLADDIRFIYDGISPDESGIYVVTRQQYQSGECHITAYKMHAEEVRLGALEEYLDNSMWILGPKTLFPVPIEAFEALTECFNYEDQEAAKSAASFFMLPYSNAKVCRIRKKGGTNTATMFRRL